MFGRGALLVMLVMLAASCDSTSNSKPDAPSTTLASVATAVATSAPTTVVHAEPAPTELITTLTALTVESLTAADWQCGDIAEPEAVRCFVDMHLASVPAVLTDRAGQRVLRSPALGTSQWLDTRSETVHECDILDISLVGPPGSDAGPTFAQTCYSTMALASVVRDGHTSASSSVPDWFTDRAPLPLCGVEIRAVHPEQRACFRFAAAAGGPAELVVADLVIDYGLSTVQWFRSLGRGNGFEVIERTQNSDMIMPDEPGASSYVEVGPWESHRYMCTSIEFTTIDAGGLGADRPLLDGCELKNL